MSLFDWLQRKGAVGSVVRNSYKHYYRIHHENPDLTKKEICEFIFRIRYKAHPMLSDISKQRLEQTEDDFSINTLQELCMNIFYIEMGVNPLDFEIYRTTLKNALIVLNQLNKKNQTHYY